MKDPAQDIDSLNSAYNSILHFIHDKVNVGSIEDTSTIIEELVADDKLREEFNALFSVLSKLFDRVLPNPAALEYKSVFRLLAFIRESVAKLTRDQRLSMKDASRKVRAIIEKYLAVNGVSLEIEPVSILSDDFLDDSKNRAKSDRAVCDEIKYAVRQYINVNMPKDPELYTRLSEKLEALLEEFKNNWAALRMALENFREEIIEGRQREKTYGYEPEHEMPFFAMLKYELYGNKEFADLKEDDFNALKDLTNDILERFKTDTKAVNFWNNESMQKTLRTHIITKLITPEIKQHVPDVFNKRKEIAQKLLELGFQHYKGNCT
jgi:type I restriction enzyme R subunit